MHADGMHALVRRAKAGDQQAWQQLHALVQPYLLGLAQRRPGPHWPEKSVSDLVQEVWARVVQRLHTFRGGDDDAQTGALFRAWLARVLANVCANARRAEATERRKPPPGAVCLDGGADDSANPGAEPAAHEASPSANVRAEEQRERVNQALEKLADPKDREVVRLRFFEELSLAQIARRLGLSYDDVRNRFHQSLLRLAPELKELR